MSINYLAHLERHEAAQINLGLYNTQTTPQALQGAIQEAEGSAISLAEVEKALRDLVSQREVIESKPGSFRSRIAETVRCLRLLRQRLWWQKDISDAPLLIEDVRVEFRQRRRPKRDAVRVEDAIPDTVDSQLADAFKQAIGFLTFSAFQERALSKVFECAQGGNPDNKSFIIAGDTGAGKTEAFLFPILLDIASEPPVVRQQPGVRAVLVYPRIRLARNQLGRLLRYTSGFHQAGGPRLTVGIQNGDVPRDRVALSEAWQSQSANGYQWYAVELLETCVVSRCDGQYWVAADDPAIDHGCPLLICDRDHTHTIDTLHITKAALEQNAPDFLIITDVSLSQWLAREKYSHLWGLWEPNQVTIPPRFLVLDEVHLYEQLKGAHISRLIKRFQARVRLAYQLTAGVSQKHPLVIGVSATLHDEQRFLAKLLDIDRYQNKKRYDRLVVIKPKAHELEKTKGRERYIFVYPRGLSPTPKSPQYRVNDQTAAIQILMVAMHNLKTKIDWRGLAFFDSINDLRQFRHNYDDSGGNIEWYRGRDVTGKQLPPANQGELWRIRTDRQSRQGKACGGCGSCSERVQHKTLDDCPTFRAGDCWIFAQGQLNGHNQELRVADSVYSGATASQLDNTDLIPSSPSLEVGYDDDAIQLVYQHKAPRSAASFIQRRGRAGRDPDDSPIIITLLWPYRRDDAFYFFRPEALYDPAFDDIPLNAGNFNVQRTHTLLAFFDLLACFRRQNYHGLANERRIVDFTLAGWHYFAPGDDVIQNITRRDDPQKGRQIIVKNRQTKRTIWFTGKHLSNQHVVEQGNYLQIRGWLLMEKGLSVQVLRPVWEKLKDYFPKYLRLSEIASPPFQDHRTYPFFTPDKGSLPTELLRRFGNPLYHSSHDKSGRSNWLNSYRHIDWMLQGSQEATTLTIHYPNPDYPNPQDEKVSPENTKNVTFALTDLLPGNITYRLGEKKHIHWTPIPAEGASTFLYPLEKDRDGHPIPDQPLAEFLPARDEITKQPDSIFGVPKHLDKQFPGLPFMTLKRLRVQEFGPPDLQNSPRWFYDPKTKQALERQAGEPQPSDCLPISRRSSTGANSVIIPYIAKERPDRATRVLLPPLSNLFATIDGLLEAGRAMAAYTRVFYEMEINIKTPTKNKALEKQGIQREDLTLKRLFYDQDGQPTLVGYAIETHGIRFQVNPDIIRQTIDQVLADEELRLRLRRNFAIHGMASYATKNKLFIKSLLDAVTVAVDYWVQKVVPQSSGEPRLLDAVVDTAPLLDYYSKYRITNTAQVQELATLLDQEFFVTLNEKLSQAFQYNQAFAEFVESIVLHSLSALLKNLIARLGGVGTSDLVAYADLPILDQVDRSIDPRILIMDTVEGGSGGIAQAFERLVLTDNEGSLWRTLQEELGNCPIANGEVLIQEVMSKATVDQIKDVQAQATPEALARLLDDLKLENAKEKAVEMLGRTIFNRIEVSGNHINPALILHELFNIQPSFEQQVPGTIAREAVVCRLVTWLRQNPPSKPNITQLRSALQAGGVKENDIDYELALQLEALYKQSCEDGCPVCLSTDSDIEHYYLTPLLNSRRVLHKLRSVLFAPTQRKDCVAEALNDLLEGDPIQIEANPGTLGEHYEPSQGLSIVPNYDDDGQVRSAMTVVTNPEPASEFLKDNDGWEKRWAKGRKIETPDGIKVRSRAEYIIATKLSHQGIAYQYEVPLAYRNAQGKTAYIHPDFYLYEHDLYLEYWGRDDAQYMESRRFKERVYEQRRIVPLDIEKNEVDNGVLMDKVLTAIERKTKETSKTPKADKVE